MALGGTDGRDRPRTMRAPFAAGRGAGAAGPDFDKPAGTDGDILGSLVRVLTAGCLLLGLLASVGAEEPSVSGIVRTVRFHPDGEPSGIGLRMLSRKGEPGWKALSGLVVSLAKEHPEVSVHAARALAEGAEPERLAHAAHAYSRCKDDSVRAVLAYGLAFRFADHRKLLLRHMRLNKPGARAVLVVLAPKVLSEKELRRYLKIPDLAPVAYAALRGRNLRVQPKELLAWARVISLACLRPAACRGWADRDPTDFTILEAIALVLAEPGPGDNNESVRDGAACLLMTVSGKKLPRDRDIWRSWLTARRDRYKKPSAGSPGEIAAAVVRGARLIRLDLIDDGRCLWYRDTGGHYQAGSTALGVLGLLAAGYPKNHPAIKKALPTLVLFGPGGAPALHSMPHRGRETYVLSMLAIALCELDAKRFRVPLQALRNRIAHGMQKSGSWGYQCLTPTDTHKGGRPDNSCAQYAVLALRALKRNGFKVEDRIWKTAEAHFRRTVYRDGGWLYHRGHGGTRRSMTAAGISSLAICLEGRYGRHAGQRIAADKHLAGGLRCLGTFVHQHEFRTLSAYAYYGVERACLLTGTTAFRSDSNTLDWYVAGAKELLRTQTDRGGMGATAGNLGAALNTAYSILFLTRATRTIGATKKGRTIRVPLKDKPWPKDTPRKKTVPKPQPPRLWIERESVPTRSGDAVIVGRLDTSGATLSIDGKPITPDVRGRFSYELTITRARDIAVVAKSTNGLETKRSVRIAFDRDAPQVRLLGPPQRHVGKQVLIFRATEPLKALRVAGRVYPADGPVVRAAVEINPGRRALTFTATDRAGNEGRGQADLEAQERHLVLDGQSALRIDLHRRPSAFTLECWVRGSAPKRGGSLIANTEGSGFALVWASRRFPFPHALVHTGKDYAAIGAGRSWKWDKWTHVAFCWDGEQGRYFVSGKLHSVGEARGPRRVSSRPLWIGAEPNRHGRPNDFFPGEMDEVRVSTVARYEKDFRPQRHFMRDRDTLVLLHFDRDTLPFGPVLDDSGHHHHATPHGAPVLSTPQPDANPLDHARAEMRGLLPPAVPVALTEKQRTAQDARARTDAQRRLGLVPVTVRLASKNGVPFPGVNVRAHHLSLDVSAGPVATDANGDAVLRLPRGSWRVDFATKEPAGGSAVFGRATFAVREPGRETVVLDNRRDVQFRSGKGALRTAHGVRLAWPDFSFHRQVFLANGRLEILTHGEAPILVQATRRPDDQGGYILRRMAGPGRTVIDTDPDDNATVHTFRGQGARTLYVRYTSADALPVDLGFTVKKTAVIRIAGPPDVVLHLESNTNGGRVPFYPRPFLIDGKPREFLGKAQFAVSVGHQLNFRGQYKDRINTVSFRVFLQTPNGLLLPPPAPYELSWEQLLDGKPRFAGTTSPSRRIMTAPINPKLFPKLRYRVHVRGPGVNKKFEVEPVGPTAKVQQGKVRTSCFPPLVGNTRHWAACVSRAMQAYEETCPRWRTHCNIDRSIHMPLPVIGMGGGGGNAGWMWLPEGSLYGFHGTWYWTGLLSHELGHVYGYGHSNPVQTRIMSQAGRRAGRRLRSIRPGMERLPEGDRYGALLEAITRGDVHVTEGFQDDKGEPLKLAGDATSAGVLVPNLEITGEDAVLSWFYRTLGPKAADARAKHAAEWSWPLTLRGFSDDEIQITILSKSAGAKLAWLARMRGIVVHDHRLEAALAILEKGPLANAKQRGGTRHHWRTKPLGQDLEAEERAMAAELGHRYDRVLARLRLAREAFRRSLPEQGEAFQMRALTEARQGSPATLDRALIDTAPMWAAR